MITDETAVRALRAAKAWVREQVDKPYVRGEAGPSDFDCAGLIEAWTKAFGDPSQTLPNPGAS